MSQEEATATSSSSGSAVSPAPGEDEGGGSAGLGSDVDPVCWVGAGSGTAASGLHLSGLGNEACDSDDLRPCRLRWSLERSLTICSRKRARVRRTRGCRRLQDSKGEKRRRPQQRSGDGAKNRGPQAEGPRLSEWRWRMLGSAYRSGYAGDPSRLERRRILLASWFFFSGSFLVLVVSACCEPNLDAWRCT